MNPDEFVYTVSRNQESDSPTMTITSVLDEFGAEKGDKFSAIPMDEAIVLKPRECLHEELHHKALGIYQCTDCGEEFEMGDEAPNEGETA